MAPIAPTVDFLTPISPSLTILQTYPLGNAVVAKVKAAFDPGEHNPPRPDPSLAPREEWAYHDALVVRRTVFGHEQKCAWELEVDDDDARSWHFNALLPLEEKKKKEEEEEEEVDKKDSEQTSAAAAAAASSVPSGTTATSAIAETEHAYRAFYTGATVRLTPGPHAPHPLPGSEDFVGGDVSGYAALGSRVVEGARDVATGMHDGRERYAKIGRVATMRSARGRGLASRLMERAMAWAAAHPEQLDRQTTTTTATANAAGVNEEDEAGVSAKWMGLVMVHAQEDVVPLYAKMGFVVDKGMGVWYEGGIPHNGMWRRVHIPGRS